MSIKKVQEKREVKPCQFIERCREEGTGGDYDYCTKIFDDCPVYLMRRRNNGNNRHESEKVFIPDY